MDNYTTADINIERVRQNYLALPSERRDEVWRILNGFCSSYDFAICNDLTGAEIGRALNELIDVAFLPTTDEWYEVGEDECRKEANITVEDDDEAYNEWRSFCEDRCAEIFSVVLTAIEAVKVEDVDDDEE